MQVFRDGSEGKDKRFGGCCVQFEEGYVHTVRTGGGVRLPSDLREGHARAS